mgnify:CR=1 FL=1
MARKFAGLILAGLLLMGMPGYGQTEGSSASMEDIKKESRELLQTIRSYSADKKDEAVEKAKEGLDTLDGRIERLEARISKNWDSMSETARQQARDNLKVLRQQRNKLAEWYGSMKTGSADAWEQIKKGFSEAYRTLEESWEKSEKDVQ